jgi:hypothetical protein
MLIRNDQDKAQAKLLDAINWKVVEAHRAEIAAKDKLAEKVALCAASGVQAAGEAVRLARVAKNWQWVLKCAGKACADGSNDVSGAVAQCVASIRRSIELAAETGPSTCPFHNAVDFAEARGDVETLRQIEALPGAVS